VTVVLFELALHRSALNSVILLFGLQNLRVWKKVGN